jgi:hypothetical protein
MSTTTIVPASVRPWPTFSGSSKDEVEASIQAINCVIPREKAFYDEADQPVAKLVMLAEGCTGKAAAFAAGLDEEENILMSIWWLP